MVPPKDGVHSPKHCPIDVVFSLRIHQILLPPFPRFFPMKGKGFCPPSHRANRTDPSGPSLFMGIGSPSSFSSPNVSFERPVRMLSRSAFFFFPQTNGSGSAARLVFSCFLFLRRLGGVPRSCPFTSFFFEPSTVTEAIVLNLLLIESVSRES